MKLRFLVRQFSSCMGHNDKKVAIISDTHAYLDKRIEEILSDSHVIVHAGDICSAELLLKIKTLADEVFAVAGNNDIPALWPAEHRDLVKNLPKTATIELPGGLLVVEHGDRYGHEPSHSDIRSQHPNARAIAYGHTHRQVCDQQSIPWVLNPGAAGKTRNLDGGHCCMVLTSSDSSWKVDSYCFS